MQLENFDPRLRGNERNSDNLNLIPGSDLAGCSHVGINPAIAVAESAYQRFRDVEVADAGSVIDVGGGAAHDAIDDFEAGVGADVQLQPSAGTVLGRGRLYKGAA